MEAKKIFVGTYILYRVTDCKIEHRETKVFKTREEAEKWLHDDMESIRSEIIAQDGDENMIMDDWRNDTDGFIQWGIGEEIGTQHTWQIVEREDPISGQLNELAERVIEWQRHLENIHAWSADTDADENAKMAEDEAWCRVRETLREITGDNDLWAC